MYTRNNIFSQTSNNITYQNAPQQQSNSYNYSNNQNSAVSSELLVGSKRLQSSTLPTRIKDLMPQWKDDHTPMSIVAWPETLHLSAVEFRLEDYYLIRNNKMAAKYQNKLREAIREDSFNEELLSKPVQLHNYSKQPSLSDEMIRAQCSKTNPSLNKPTNNPNGYGGNNSNSNMYGAGQSSSSSNNIFMNNRTTTGNIFSNNSTAANSNTSGQGAFNQNRSTTGANMFSNNPSAPQGQGSIFGNNNNTTSGNYASSGQSGNTTPTNNIFGNNSNANTSSANIFNRNTTNTQSSGSNPFANNNSNTGNNTSGNNLFANNTNNSSSNTGSNLFSNNNQQQQQPQTYNIDMNLVMQAFNNYVQNSQMFLQHQNLNAQTNQPQEKQKEEEPQKQNVWSSMRDYDHTENYAESFQKQKRFNLSRRREDQEYIMLIPRRPKEMMLLKKVQNDDEEFQNMPYNQTTHFHRPPKNDTVHRNASIKIHEANPTKSVRMTNILPTKSIRLSNHRDEFSSMIYSRYDVTVNQTKTRQLKLVFEYPCRCVVSLQIFWQECQKKQQKVHLKNPTSITLQIDVSQFDFQTEQGRKEFELELKKHPPVRADAKFTPERRKTEIDQDDGVVKVTGKVEQKIVNLDQQERGKATKNTNLTPKYTVQYSKIADNHIYNLTISRQGKGTIVWENPVPFQALDFKKDALFYIEDCEIGCELIDLQGACIVTFETLPPKVEQIKKSKGLLQAKCNLQKLLQKANKGIQFCEMWENGTWCCTMKNGFDN